MKLKTGDAVKILSGKDRGKRGKIMRVLPARSVGASARRAESLILVEGVNMKKRHRRSRRQDKKGEVVLIPAPVALSRVQLVCKSCGQPARAGWKTEGDLKIRICKKCGQVA